MNNTVLKLLPEHLQNIRTHAESTYPDECCGIILGYLAIEGKTAVEVMPTANAWSTEAANFSQENAMDSERQRYAIAPQVMLQVQREARDRSLNIIGIYHSHTDNPAIPSECDRIYAWQGYSYIIVSVQNGKAGELKSWSLDNNHQFQLESIENVN
ncbi:M67 family metallopeptidase [Nostocaceae cyanobacterium CENA369]|uniref:M67 family metallopeptidase n=1 Tax=Dendronalium phyllosphericum CENA369 TaxID=1725256 RepID=A0A8J7I1C0_9NOST|nr:M67 family metallopeptidase [Dendronalium phyllosphericum]MBH8572800.1 M67 family metallopeptidase [Dendronalium phyllosphericum CENA369]